MNHWPEFLALTGTERKVAMFLVGAFIVGSGIRLFRETFPPDRSAEYRSSDSTFAALSAAPAAGNHGNRVPSQQQGLLDINTASKEQLVTLPGIGQVTAERIILYRDENGPFSTAEELRNIKGISKRKLETIKPLIIVH